MESTPACLSQLANVRRGSFGLNGSIGLGGWRFSLVASFCCSRSEIGAERSPRSLPAPGQGAGSLLASAASIVVAS